MSLETRLVRLARRNAGSTGLARQWLGMLTRLSAAVLADPGDGAAARALEPADHAALRETAERYAGTGAPATIGDLFRLARADGGDDARH